MIIVLFLRPTYLTMNRLIKSASLLLLLMLISLAGCTKSKSYKQVPDARKQVLCTIGMIADIAKAVGQDKISISTLIKEDLDPHSYELVKGDDEKLSSADLIFYNGLGLEHSPNICLHLNQHPNSHAIGEYIQKNYPSLILSTNGQVDPHIWMDISVWEKGIRLVVNKLSEMEPKEASFFQSNGLRLQEKMKKTHFAILKMMHEIPEEKRYLITCHDAFYYFTKGYLSNESEKETEAWRARFIAPEGLAPDSQLSTNDIQKVIHFLKTHHIKTIFPEYNVNLDSIYKIKEVSNKSGLNVKISSKALYGDTMCKNSKSNENYLDMIFYNAKVIHQYLTEGEVHD